MIPQIAQARADSTLTHMIHKTEIENLFFLFMFNCKSRSLSDKTQKDYLLKVGHFVKYCLANELTDPKEIRDLHIEMFLIIKQQTCQAVSVADYYRCIKRFFNWLLKKKIIEINPMAAMDPPKFKKRIIEPFKPAHIRQLLAQCDLNDSRFELARNKAIILMFLDTGLRLAELANIKLDDMDEESEIIKVLGKGAKERLVSITPGVMEAICYYMIIRKKTFPNNANRALWLNRTGDIFKTAGIQEMIGEMGKRAGLQGVRCSPHTFRHTFGTMFMDNAAEVGDPENAAGELQTLLGHETQVMTRHYTENAKRRVALKAHKKYSPLRNLNFEG